MREFAAATGQLWKYRVWRVLSFAEIIGAVVMLVLVYMNPAGLGWALGLSVFAVTFLAALIWRAAAFRCPRCGARPAWYQMTHGKAMEVEKRIAMTKECPACSFNPLRSGTVAL
jgi:hypothetical protein